MNRNSDVERDAQEETSGITSTLIETALRVAPIWWLAQICIVLSLAFALPLLDGCAEKDITPVTSTP